MENEKFGLIYCPACNRYDMESKDEDNPVCPVCGANAQWEDEITLFVSPLEEKGSVSCRKRTSVKERLSIIF